MIIITWTNDKENATDSSSAFNPFNDEIEQKLLDNQEVDTQTTGKPQPSHNLRNNIESNSLDVERQRPVEKLGHQLSIENYQKSSLGSR